MATQREIQIRLSLANPGLLDRLKVLSGSQQNMVVNLELANPRLLNQLEHLSQNQTINLTVNAANSVSELRKIENQFKEIQKLSAINVQIGGTPTQTLRNIQQEILKTLPKALTQAATGLAAQSDPTIAGRTRVQFSAQQTQAVIDAVDVLEQASKNIQKNAAATYNKPTPITAQQYAQKAVEERELERRFRTGDISARRFIGTLTGRGQQTDQEIGGELIAAGLSPQEVGSIFGKNRSTNGPLGGAGKFFDRSRLGDLREKELTELGFAFLSHGPAGLIGGLAGAATPLGAGGIFLGSAIAGVGAEALEKVFRTIEHGIHTLIEAGSAYQESLLSISATLQHVSPVTGAGGRELSTTEELAVQQSRAREIQAQARAQLLPLGIGGRAESTIVSAVQSGTGLRGFNFDAKDIATLSRRFGSAAGVFNPQLLQNPSQLRRDVEDILLGLPQASRTTLGAAIRPVVSKVALARSEDEVLSATKSLDAFADTLKNSDLAIVQWNRTLGATDGIVTVLGEKMLRDLTPALKTVGDITTGASQLTQLLYGDAETQKAARNEVVQNLVKNGLTEADAQLKAETAQKKLQNVGNTLLDTSLLFSPLAAFVPILQSSRAQQKPETPEFELSKSAELQAIRTRQKGGISEEVVKAAGKALDETDFATKINALSQSIGLRANAPFVSAEELRKHPEKGISIDDLTSEQFLQAQLLDARAQQERGTFNIQGLAGRRFDLARGTRLAQTQQVFAGQALSDLDRRLQDPTLSEGETLRLKAGKGEFTRRSQQAFAQEFASAQGGIDLALAGADRKVGLQSEFNVPGRRLAEISGLEGASASAKQSLADAKDVLRRAIEAGTADPAQIAAMRQGIAEMEDTIGTIGTRIGDSLKKAKIELLQQAGLGIDVQGAGGREFARNQTAAITDAQLEAQGVSPERRASFIQLQKDRSALNSKISDSQTLNNLARNEQQFGFAQQNFGFSQRQFNLDTQSRALQGEELARQKAEQPLKLEAIGLKSERIDLEIEQVGLAGKQLALSMKQNALALDQNALNVKQLALSVKQNALSFKQADLSIDRLKLSMDDSRENLRKFQSEGALRDLSRKSGVIGAAQRLAELEGNTQGEGGYLASQVGVDIGDPESIKQFEINLAREQGNAALRDVSFGTEKDKRDELAQQLGLKGQGLDLESAYLNKEGLGLQAEGFGLQGRDLELQKEGLGLQGEGYGLQGKGLGIQGRELALQKKLIPFEKARQLAAGSQIDIQAAQLTLQQEAAVANQAQQAAGLDAQRQALNYQRIGAFQQFAGTSQGDKLLKGAQESAVNVGIDPQLVADLQKSSKAQAEEAKKANADIATIANAIGKESIKELLSKNNKEMVTEIKTAIKEGIKEGLN